MTTEIINQMMMRSMKNSLRRNLKEPRKMEARKSVAKESVPKFLENLIKSQILNLKSFKKNLN